MKHFQSSGNNLFLLLLLLVFASCKKEAVQTGEIPKVKTVANPYDTSTYEYDSQGRITRLANTDYTYVFSYGPGVMMMEHYNESGTLVNTYRYDLNEQGLRTMYQRVYPASGLKYGYTYNNASQLSTLSYYTNDEVTMISTYYYSNNLLDSIRSVHVDGWLRDIYHYEYYPNIKSTITFENLGLQYEGAVRMGTIKKQDLRVFNSSGTQTSHTLQENSYETDAKGRITKRKLFVDGAPYNEYTYTYY